MDTTDINNIQDSLTDNNRTELLGAINLILSEYAFGRNGVVNLRFKTHEEADHYRKLHRFLTRYSAVKELDPYMGYQYIEEVGVKLFFSVDKDKLLQLKNALENKKIIQIQNSKTNPRDVPLQELPNAYDHSFTYTVSLSLNQKTLKLYIYPDKIFEDITYFKTRSANNYIACKMLCRRKKRLQTKEELGIKDAKTVVKDLGKTMGLSGPLKELFYAFDSKEQTVALNDNVKIKGDELENLVKYCKLHFRKR